MSTGIRLPPVSRRLGGVPSADQRPGLPSHPGEGSPIPGGYLPAVGTATGRCYESGRAPAALHEEGPAVKPIGVDG